MSPTSTPEPSSTPTATPVAEDEAGTVFEIHLPLLQ
jgi:hypothetical protein